jgi:hypothetical protein
MPISPQTKILGVLNLSSSPVGLARIAADTGLKHLEVRHLCTEMADAEQIVELRKNIFTLPQKG